MSKQPNKSPYVPLLVDRLDIGESTAWLWLKESETVTSKTLWQFSYRSRRVSICAKALEALKVKRAGMRKPLKYLLDNLTVLSETKKRRGLKAKREYISLNSAKLAEMLGIDDVEEHSVENMSKYIQTCLQQLVRINNEIEKLSQAIKSAEHQLKTRNCVLTKRRVQAAITSTRTDWTPIADVAGHLESQFGVTIKQIAEWYGYNPHSIYGIIGKGRFVDKRPKRALTLIDYYLKENELC